MKITFDILVLIGTLTFFSSVFYLKPGVPIASLKPKAYVTRQRRRGIFVGPGYKLNTFGLLGMSFGGIGVVGCLVLLVFGMWSW